MKKIETADAPKALGFYSQAVVAGPFLFVSGQVGIDPKTGKLIDETIQGQTAQVLANIEAILIAAGLTWKEVVKVEMFLKDLAHFQEVNVLYGKKLSHPIKPARQTVEVSKLPLDALIEISCIVKI